MKDGIKDIVIWGYDQKNICLFMFAALLPLLCALAWEKFICSIKRLIGIQIIMLLVALPQPASQYKKKCFPVCLHCLLLSCCYYRGWRQQQNKNFLVVGLLMNNRIHPLEVCLHSLLTCWYMMKLKWKTQCGCATWMVWSSREKFNHTFFLLPHNATYACFDFRIRKCFYVYARWW